MSYFLFSFSSYPSFCHETFPEFSGFHLTPFYPSSLCKRKKLTRYIQSLELKSGDEGRSVTQHETVGCLHEVSLSSLEVSEIRRNTQSRPPLNGNANRARYIYLHINPHNKSCILQKGKLRLINNK